MPLFEELNVPYHQQDTDYYCGAACAQMVLAQIGAGVLDQNSLYNDNHNHSVIESGWYSGPDGVTWTMNNRKPASFDNYFVLFSLANEDSISRKIVWTIHHYQVAPIAMVYGSNHWLVVEGYQATNMPTDPADTSYALLSFDVNNPWPPTPAGAAEPPHSVGDGCGTGGTRGVANENIAYATWQSTYMTGVPGGHWNGRFLAVCDPEPAPERHGHQIRVQESLPGDRIVDVERARELAVEGLKRYGLAERDSWRKVLTDARPGQPVVVQRLDRVDEFYHLTAMVDAEQRSCAMVSTDARFGNYRQAVQLGDQGHALNYHWTRDELLKVLMRHPIRLREPFGRLVIRPETLCICPHLVWKPCRESLSPYWPFYLITAGAHSIYIRVDGAIFTHLTSDLRGI